MNGARVLAICRHDLRILQRERGPLVVLIGMPLVVTWFLTPAYRQVLRGQGYAGANGAEQSVPGLAVMFSFFLVTYVGFAFFREHGWRTWDRLRASPARPAEVLIGKLVPLLGLGLLQQAVLFGAGSWLFGLRVRGSPVALAGLAVILSCVLLLYGVLLVAVCRSVQQLSALSYLSAMFMGGIGGALSPVSLLPRWVRAVAPFTPGYWAVQGYQAVILDGAGPAGVLRHAGVLALFGVVLGVLAIRQFKSDETKTAWA